MRHIDRIDEPKHNYKRFLQKAEEFYSTAGDMLEKGRYNSASMEGIHCAISCCDALTVFYLGQRAHGRRHTDAAELLKDIRSLPAAEVDARIRQFREILDFKTPVEYGGDIFSAKEAGQIVLRSGRFLQWCRAHLG